MALHILYMVLMVYGFNNFGEASINNQNDLPIKLGALRLRLCHGLHSALARMVFLDSAYYGQEFVKRRIKSQNCMRDLTEKMDQHKANRKVRLL